MGIFDRISNIVKGKVNAGLDEIENPIELLDQKLRDMDEQLSKAKLSSATVLGNSHEIEKKLDAAKKERDDYESKVKLALSKGNEDLAKRALAKKVEADKKVTSLEASYANAKAQADALKSNLHKLQEQIESTRSKRDENAKSAEQVNAILADVKTGFNDTISMDEIERKIAKKESTAAGLGELADMNTSLDDEFKALGDVDLDAELANTRIVSLNNRIKKLSTGYMSCAF